MSETHKLRTNEILPKSSQFQEWNIAAESLAKSCESASMPNLDHLKMVDYDNVYEPSDDTYLMLDALNCDFGIESDGDGNDRTGADGTGNESRSNDTGEAEGGNGNGNDGISDDEGKDRIATTTLELGCGTGVNTIFLAQMLSQNQSNDKNENNDKKKTNRKKKLVHIVTDINEHAIQVTKRMARHNINTITIDEYEEGSEHIYEHEHEHEEQQQQQLQTYHCDLATPLLQSHKRQIDILIFNPPYVPTPNDEVGQFVSKVEKVNSASASESASIPKPEPEPEPEPAPIEASWAGGTNGRVVIDKSLPQIATLLSYPHGVAYMITVDDNKPEEIASIMKERYNISVRPFLRRRARNEFLTVLKMTHNKSNKR